MSIKLSVPVSDALYVSVVVLVPVSDVAVVLVPVSDVVVVLVPVHVSDSECAPVVVLVPVSDDVVIPVPVDVKSCWQHLIVLLEMSLCSAMI